MIGTKPQIQEAQRAPKKTNIKKSIPRHVALSCPTLCNPMDCIVHGIPQDSLLEWVAFPFSRGSSQPRDRTQVSCIAGGFFTH